MLFDDVKGGVDDSAREISRAQLKRYREVISMWLSKYDTAEIARELNLPEWLAARWVANFRDLMAAVA
jgi:hypothetical protein